MALKKMTKLALKAMSNKDLNMKKNYKRVRKVFRVTHPAYCRWGYQTWDKKMVYNGIEVPVRIFSATKKKGPILVLFHGGGWVTGDIDSYTRVCSDLARYTGCHVVSVDYRLAPEHKFPAAPEDCYYVTKMVMQHAKEYFDIDANQITLIGDSAGANLAAVVSQMARDRGEFEVARQILIYPAVNNDFSANSEFDSIRENGTEYFLTSKRLCDYMDLYQSSPEDRKNPYFAPILAEDFSNQPKTLVITAQYDPLRDEGEAYARKLAEAGNEVELHRIADVIHGFFTRPMIYPPVRECFGLIKTFLKEPLENETKED